MRNVGGCGDQISRSTCTRVWFMLSCKNQRITRLSREVGWGRRGGRHDRRPRVLGSPHCAGIILYVHTSPKLGPQALCSCSPIDLPRYLNPRRSTGAQAARCRRMLAFLKPLNLIHHFPPPVKGLHALLAMQQIFCTLQ
jgi:hypothetical protein